MLQEKARNPGMEDARQYRKEEPASLASQGSLFLPVFAFGRAEGEERLCGARTQEALSPLVS